MAFVIRFAPATAQKSKQKMPSLHETD